MNVNFNGFSENCVTFIADSTVTKANLPVKMSENGTVTAVSAGDPFCGICVGVRDGYATVQLSGYIEMATTTNIGVGYKNLVGVSENLVAESTTGREYLVVTSTATTVGFIL